MNLWRRLLGLDGFLALNRTQTSLRLRRAILSASGFRLRFGL